MKSLWHEWLSWPCWRKSAVFLVLPSLLVSLIGIFLLIEASVYDPFVGWDATPPVRSDADKTWKDGNFEEALGPDGRVQSPWVCASASGRGSRIETKIRSEVILKVLLPVVLIFAVSVYTLLLLLLLASKGETTSKRRIRTTQILSLAAVCVVLSALLFSFALDVAWMGTVFPGCQCYHSYVRPTEVRPACGRYDKFFDRDDGRVHSESPSTPYDKWCVDWVERLSSSAARFNNVNWAGTVAWILSVGVLAAAFMLCLWAFGAKCCGACGKRNKTTQQKKEISVEGGKEGELDRSEAVCMKESAQGGPGVQSGGENGKVESDDAQLCDHAPVEDVERCAEKMADHANAV
uniref:Uncharacterized protein n=1 Tax=Chromera velia CCMP2878 TaxID=1169474 RepID=A0A0G4HUQ5_9ALVE|eukprot:Cvel_8702.t1-p1 / transcript=Cvel_8702.t1 / gene=Cvel_8702 / organism=Chromera_velia_CCMP2878 / gene_product=hypothetical protein / transcript_product=hypothetical protein / location=Cvel_scaffold485:81851-82894(+) / protein_length=348 / sequence_SO=supercontig / SO=protein_coding / is_pseudo=false